MKKSNKTSLPTIHDPCVEILNCRVANVSPVVLTEMYRTLTSDCTAVPNPEITNRLRQFIDADYDYLSDTSIIVVDLRHLNEGRCSQFDTFWSYLEIVLQDYCEGAANDRRHGDAHMPVAISTPNLKRKSA